FSRFANSFESITSVSFNCIRVPRLIAIEFVVDYEQMEWQGWKPKWEWIKGNGLRERSPPCVFVIAPIRRPFGGRIALCVRFCVRPPCRSDPLFQEFGEQWVIELVSASSCTNKHAFFS